MLANIHSILLVNQATACLYDVPRTHDVGLPTQFRVNVGPSSQPIASSMLVNCLRRWPNTNSIRVCCIICASASANTWHSPNAVLMLIHNLRRWSSIETASGDCHVIAGRLCYADDAFLHVARKATSQVCDAGPTVFQRKSFKL